MSKKMLSESGENRFNGIGLKENRFNENPHPLDLLEARHSCTTILVGSHASANGSYMVARNEDYKASSAKNFVYHKAEARGAPFHSSANDFTYKGAKNALQYTSISDYDTGGKSMGEVGFNSAGVGMSATETIFASPRALALDPYVEDTGINEDSILDVILPRIKSAKEGVELLGKIIEEKGAAEGFGVAFVDKEGIWYLETGSAHQWLARKIPEDRYFVSANQGRLVEYIEDDERYLASPTLVSFAIDNGLWRPMKEGEPFDFFAAYTANSGKDALYNYPRVWVLQHMYTEGQKTTIDSGDYPVFLPPTKKLTLEDVKNGLKNHYQGTSHNPYGTGNAKDPHRPISVFRTQESHIVEVRPGLPKEIGQIVYIAYGMSALGLYLPYYAGMDKVPKPLRIGTNRADSRSANWAFRKVQTLAMQDFNAYAPIVQKAYAKFEQAIAKDKEEMEREYLSVYKSDKKTATKLINDFEAKMIDDALALAERLTNKLFTLLTNKVDSIYRFAGA